MSAGAVIEAGGREIEISHPEKVLFPGEGISKLDLARYYVRVSDLLLPFMRDRPIHVRSYPEGIEGKGFVRKRVQSHYPDWIATAEMPKREGGAIDQVVACEPGTLVYLVSQNAVSLHGWLSRADRPEDPDQLIIDLDPTGDDFGEVREAAAVVADVLARIELPAYLKTTGSRGLHVVSPLDRSCGFEQVRELARAVARLVAAERPDELTVEQRKDKRADRLFVDWLRNGYAQTAVLPYSVRARPGASVAMPIDWDELARVDARSFTVANVFRRLAQKRDPWAELRRSARSAAAPLERARELEAELD